MIKALNKTSRDKDRVDLLLNLAQFHTFKPGELSADLDSAADFIRQARQLNFTLLSQQVEGYILLSESHLANEYKDRTKARQLLEQATQILEKEKEKDYDFLGKAYMSLADYFDIDNAVELPDRMRAFKHAIAAFEQGGHIEQEAFAYKMLAEADSSDVTMEEELNKALSLYNSINYPQLQGVYDLFASMYIYRSNFAEALKWGLRALKTAETVGDSSMQLCTINNHIAITHQYSHDSVNAIKYFRDALRIAERNNDKSTIYLLTQNIARLYFETQQPAFARDLLQHVQQKFGPPEKKLVLSYYRFVNDFLKVYTLLKQFQLAEPYFLQLAAIENENQLRDYDRSDIYVNILDYFLASGQYNRMLPYLKKDQDMAKAYGSLRNLARLHKLWFSYDTSQHNYKSAVNHLLQVNKLHGEINTQAKDRMTKELQVQFDTKKKEDQIALLDKQSQLEKANLKQAVLVKNVTIVGIIGAFIIAGLLYRQNRVKQRNNNLITQKNDQLQHYLTEKEWLLKEIHHRVKNNLQIVMSLLNSQSAYIDNEPALTAIHDSQHRVHAMSLIHQKLYNSENLSSIDMSIYIRELVSYLSESFVTGQRIRFELNVDSLELDVSQAVPLGLILNEAITNAIKYAFPDGRNGIISISLSRASGDQYLLSISDNGIGMPTVVKKTGSLGMTLMKGLSEDLDGIFSIENKNGTSIKISFVHDAGLENQELSTPSFISNN